MRAQAASGYQGATPKCGVNSEPPKALTMPQPESLFLSLLIFWEKEREISTCCSTYGCTHWLVPACALTRDGTGNLGAWGRHSKPLNHPARAQLKSLYSFWVGRVPTSRRERRQQPGPLFWPGPKRPDAGLQHPQGPRAESESRAGPPRGAAPSTSMMGSLEGGEGLEGLQKPEQ